MKNPKEIINHISDIECDVIKNQLPIDIAINKLNNINYHSIIINGIVQDIKSSYNLDNQMHATLCGAKPASKIFILQAVKNKNPLVITFFSQKHKYMYRPVNTVDFIKISENIKTACSNLYKYKKEYKKA